jgi:hypothetical protein
MPREVSLYHLSDPSAVAANRRGELSAAQRAALRNVRVMEPLPSAPPGGAGGERVAQAEGRIKWGGRAYVAEAGGGGLLSVTGDLNLPPGAYRFFFLPVGRLLLSAERLGRGAGGAAGEEGLRKALAEANGFSLGALAEHRAGRVTRDDLSRLKRWVWPRAAWALLCAAGAGAASYVIAVSWRAGDYYATLEPTPNVGKAQEHYILAFWMTVPLALCLSAGVRLLWRLRRVVPELRATRAAAVEGVGWRATGGTLLRRYFYEIDEARFAVPRRAFNALVDGLTYRAYHLPRSGVLLSIEPTKEG